MQPRPSRKSQQIHPARGDILAHLSGEHAEPSSVEFVMEFSVDQMDLTQVGLAGVTRHSRTMLDQFAAVGVALDPTSRKQSNAPLIWFRECMRRAAAHGTDSCPHQRMLSSQSMIAQLLVGISGKTGI